MDMRPFTREGVHLTMMLVRVRDAAIDFAPMKLLPFPGSNGHRSMGLMAFTP